MNNIFILKSRRFIMRKWQIEDKKIVLKCISTSTAICCIKIVASKGIVDIYLLRFSENLKTFVIITWLMTFRIIRNFIKKHIKFCQYA